MILRSIGAVGLLLLAGSCGRAGGGPTTPEPAVATFTSTHFEFHYPLRDEPALPSIPAAVEREYTRIVDDLHTDAMPIVTVADDRPYRGFERGMLGVERQANHWRWKSASGTPSVARPRALRLLTRLRASIASDYSTPYPSACAFSRTRTSRVTTVTSGGGSPSISAVARCSASRVRIGSIGNGRRTRASTASVTATR